MFASESITTLSATCDFLLMNALQSPAVLMRTIAYTSNATREINDVDLRDLFARAAEFNATHDVTGLLVFSDGNFLQTIEGFDDNVQAVYERIQRDLRHTITSVLIDEPIQRRMYPGWAMMATLRPADATLLSFLQTRKEWPSGAFTAGQRLAIEKTLVLVQHGQ